MTCRQGSLWAIVLAGGEGVRLRALTGLVHGDDRPKQYADLDGRGPMLARTLDRVAWLVPPERTIVVTQRKHDAFTRRAAIDPRIRVFSQPCDRGTAAAVMWPSVFIAARDATADVITFPSDHFVRDEQAMVAHLRDVAAGVRDGRIVLFGARAATPETGYGWIEVGRPVAEGPAGLFRVRSFSEKPSGTDAERFLARGDLWNTLLCRATVRSMVAVVHHTLPALGRSFAALADVSDGSTRVAESAYAAISTADLSRHILQVVGRQLLVSKLPAIGWSDWGTPERVLETLAGASLGRAFAVETGVNLTDHTVDHPWPTGHVKLSAAGPAAPMRGVSSA